MPRIKTDEERGYIAAWMRRERLARGWSEYQVVDALPDGRKIRPDYYRQLEAASGGKRPSPELLRAFIEVFGSEPEPFPEPPPPEPSGAADLVSAIRELVAEVRLARIAHETSAETLAELVGVVAGLADPEGTRDGDGQPDGAGTLAR